MVAPTVFSSGFKVAFVAIWKVLCGELQDCFTRCTKPSTCREMCAFYAGQVVSQNLLLNVDPLSTICNNKLIVQGEELETSAKVESFVSNISSLRLKWAYKR